MVAVDVLTIALTAPETLVSGKSISVTVVILFPLLCKVVMFSTIITGALAGCGTVDTVNKTMCIYYNVEFNFMLTRDLVNFSLGHRLLD